MAHDHDLGRSDVPVLDHLSEAQPSERLTAMLGCPTKTCVRPAWGDATARPRGRLSSGFRAYRAIRSVREPSYHSRPPARAANRGLEALSEAAVIRGLTELGGEPPAALLEDRWAMIETLVQASGIAEDEGPARQHANQPSQKP